MTEIFISHSREDKDTVDAITDFLLRCGVPSEVIFCSSLSGNGVKREISNEIKQALVESKVNIAVLSDTYYKSPYCLNEAGILWYLDTPTIVIGLPELTHTNMQGFLNSDNYIRRLDNRDDILAIADLIKEYCKGLVCSVAKMSDNVEKLSREYTASVQRRNNPTPSEDEVTEKTDMSELEKRILENDFSDGELLFLKYFYDTQTREIVDDMLAFNEWYLHQPYIVPTGDIPLQTLNEEKIVEKIYNELGKESIGYRLTLPSFRQLRKVSSNVIAHMNDRFNQYKVEQKGMLDNWNAIDWYIHNELSEEEKLLILYILWNNNKTLGTGWQTNKEIENIEKWEQYAMLDGCVSKHYADIVNKFLARAWLEVCEVTQYGNPKEYSLTETAAKMIFEICDETRQILKETLQKHAVSF